MPKSSVVNEMEKKKLPNVVLDLDAKNNCMLIYRNAQDCNLFKTDSNLAFWIQIRLQHSSNYHLILQDYGDNFWPSEFNIPS